MPRPEPQPLQRLILRAQLIPGSSFPGKSATTRLCRAEFRPKAGRDAAQQHAGDF